MDARTRERVSETVPENVTVFAKGVKLCVSRMDARGLGDPDFVNGANRGSMAELVRWSVESDGVFTF